jgi:hypothetical protein
MKHWFNWMSWKVADFMCKQVFKKIQSVMVVERFIFLSVNDVITIDNQLWISIHVYVM